MDTVRQNLNYSYKELESTLFAVFKSVYIRDFKMKQILQASYRNNLYLFVEYALTNGIDPKAHILGIRRILLESEYVSEKIKKQNVGR